MKSLAILASLCFAAAASWAQGTPSSAGQTESPQAASSASRAVEARHEKVLARANARYARRAAKAASASSR